MSMFYSINEWAIGGPKYPWASGYGPLPSMPFLEASPVFYESLKRYWQVNPEAPGMSIDPGGRSWSDVIGCGNPPPSFFVSERVILDLEEEGIPIFRATEMPIAEVLAKRLQKITPPRYFVLEAAAGISVDFGGMNVATDQNGRPQYSPAQRMKRPPLQFDIDSWDGSDLFSMRNCSDPMYLICTQRIVDLATNKNWSNIEFKPIG